MNPLYHVLFILLLVVCNGTHCNAATITDLPALGSQPIVTTPQGKTKRLYSSSHALLISQAAYLGTAAQGWRSLDSTVPEMDDLAAELQLQGFQVRRVSNATGDELHAVYRKFIAEFGHAVDSRLVFFFSGHGYTNPATKTGYIVPIDAKDPARFPTDFYSKAMPIQQLELWAKEIESRHALFIFDSCFSGSIFGSKAIAKPEVVEEDRWRFLSEKAQLPVRQFISAGSADEELPARSIFSPLFLKGLQGAMGRGNSDGYVTGKEIGLWIEQTLPGFTKNQNPHSDVIRDPLLSFGDIVFQIPSRETLTTAQATAADDKKWNESKQTNSYLSYREYLTTFPQGRHVEAATRLAVLLEGKSPPATLPQQTIPAEYSASAFSQELALKSMARPKYWVYLGIATGTKLDSKTFSLPRLPQKGEEISSSVNVTKRITPPTYSGDEWRLGPANGVLKAGQKVTVAKIEKIESTSPGDDVVWAQVVDFK